MLQNKALLIIVSVIISLIAGTFMGIYYAENFMEHAAVLQEQDDELNETRGGGYTFINPLLECDNFKPSRLKSLVKMETELKNYVAQSVASGTSSHISVYFRGLSNGPWIGINHDQVYSPASLLKVPIMIAVLKKAESNPDMLNKEVFYKEPVDRNYKPNINSQYIVPGNNYTVLQLLEYMIVHSDNEAKVLLLHIIGEDFTAKVMSELGVSISGVDMNKDFISVRGYSSFFRLLYNATYLNRDMSEMALDILSRSQFDRGIRGGVPRTMQVAHKFGERGFIDSNLKQLHDCGIVYNNGTSYLICIMTKGDDFNELATVISDISALVYKNISVKK